MRKECAGCGAILPQDVTSCPICGGLEFKDSRASAPPKQVRSQPAQISKDEGIAHPSMKKDEGETPQKEGGGKMDHIVSGSSEDDSKKEEMERFFMETITQLILGGVEEEQKEAGEEPIQRGAGGEGGPKLIIHEIILFKEDKTEILRKKYGTEICSGIEVMRVRDFLSSSEYKPGQMLYVDPEKRLVLFGGPALIFLLKITGSLHPQSEFVVKKVAEVGGSRISTASPEVTIEHLRTMMEKLCDALHSALMKLAG